jgi:hypothetical protein
MGVFNLFGFGLDCAFFGHWRSLVWSLAVCRLNKRKKRWCFEQQFSFHAAAIGRRPMAVGDGGEQWVRNLLSGQSLA